MAGKIVTQEMTPSGQDETDLRAVTEHLLPGDKEVVMKALGYKGVWKPSLIKSELCKRCDKKVYPVEKVDVGVLYHRSCFKCRSCNMQLTMQNFQREIDPTSPNDTKDIYCKQHVPILSTALRDSGAVGIRSALDAQKKASAVKIGHNQSTAEGWQYDSQAIEFQRAKEKKQNDEESQKKRRRRSLRRKSSLFKWKDLMVNGMFEAQTQLEEVHRKEEDELYQQIYEDRQKHVDQLQRQMETDKISKIKRLIEFFDSKGMSQSGRDHTLKKVERFFKSVTERRMGLLMKRLAVEEKAAVARMIERQSHEMLALIAQKEMEIEEKLKADEFNNFDMIGEEPAQRQSDEMPSEGEESSDSMDDVLDISESTPVSRQDQHKNKEEHKQETIQGDVITHETIPDDVTMQETKKRDAGNFDLSTLSDSDSDDNKDESSLSTVPTLPAANYHHVTNDNGLPSTEDMLDEFMLNHPYDNITVLDSSGSILYPNDKFALKAPLSPSMELFGMVPSIEDILDELNEQHTPDDLPATNLKDSTMFPGNKIASQTSQPFPVAQTETGFPAPGNLYDVHSQLKSTTSTSHEKLEQRNVMQAKEIHFMVVEKLHPAPQRFDERSNSNNTVVYQSVHNKNAKNDSSFLQHELGDMRELAPTSSTDHFLLKSGSQKLQSNQNASTQPSIAISGSNTGNSATSQVTTDLPELPSSPRLGRRTPRVTEEHGQNFSPAKSTSAKQNPVPSISKQLKDKTPMLSSTADAHKTKEANDAKLSPRVQAEEEQKTPRKDHRINILGTKLQTPGDGITEISISMEKTPNKTAKQLPAEREKSKANKLAQPVTNKTKVTQSKTSSKLHAGGSSKKKEKEDDEGSESDDDDIEDDDGNIKQPKIKPAKTSKSKLIKDAKIFKDLDSRAIEETRKELTTFTDLVRRLSARCNTELEIVRAIFRWITAKDLNKIEFSEDVDPNTPMGLLRGIKYGTESYHDLFKRLCSYAGLHCEIIDGYSKGLGFRPGMTFKGHKFRNQWTAVNVDGSWRFINCNWGARHVKSSDDELPTYAVDEFYFLTDAEDHIYQHFPDKAEWQLLKQPLTMEQFLRLPVAKSPFFNHGLHFVVQNHDCVLQTVSGRVQLRLTAPKLYKYNISLQSANNSIESDVILDRCYTRTVNNDLVVTAILPVVGYYYLDVYVSRHWSETVTHHACAFLIKCTEVYSGVASLTFPQEEAIFGATPAMRRYGLSPSSHIDSYISCNGELQVKFLLHNDVKLGHSLLLWNGSEKRYVDYTKYACLTQRTDTDAVFKIRFPQQSLYVLRFSTGSIEDHGHDNLDCFFRYLIHCKGAHENALPFPKVSKKLRGLTLLKPLFGNLSANSTVKFQLLSPSAIAVAVVIGNQWSYLQNTKDSLWEGNVKIVPQAKKATICTKLNENSDKFTLSAEYRISNNLESRK